MRVLITGARGQLGHELLRLAPAGFAVSAFDRDALDITDSARMTRVLAKLRPEVIINAAADTAVDQAENAPERAFAVNRDAVAHLAREAQALGCAVLHVSTDYVFAGDTPTPRRESEPSGPLNVYGASKLAGEVALAGACSRHLILRTSWVFGSHGNNFVKTMLRLAGERNRLEVVADQYGSPTPAASIANALWHLAERYRADGELQWGTYHFSGAPVCSWHAFALEIMHQAVDLGLLTRVPQVLPISTAHYPSIARRPAHSALDCRKLQDAYAIAQPDWRVELRDMLRRL